MYQAKELLNRMKQIASVDSNAALAKLLNVSYNTLNTWLKRNKLPQELILEFSDRYGCSLDYLFKGAENPQNSKNLFADIDNSTKDIKELPYFGSFEPLNLKFKSVLEIDCGTIHSDSYYLFKKDGICFIAQAFINPFKKEVKLLNGSFLNKTLSLEEFLEIKIGLIISIK